ncbi:hypothetical protein [Absidia glauca]|uniref:Exonuclease domain-containing protein n=1 Tax=Absidia glauca TaxID=4829 RepID=A0A168R955_ABSGL|nr:hypothetical protein [Absidia glauca]
MNAWCVEQHGKSGLTEAVLTSCITTEDAEQKVLQFLEQHLPGLKGSVPLAGNSVHADKRFLEKEMPLIIDYLHYRIIDVSTIKELTKRWYPKAANSLVKKNMHRAMDDIKESIEELKYYRQHVFIHNQ